MVFCVGESQSPQDLLNPLFLAPVQYLFSGTIFTLLAVRVITLCVCVCVCVCAIMIVTGGTVQGVLQASQDGHCH